jgi:hypothetical protein
MAWRFMDSFDHYDTAQQSLKYGALYSGGGTIGTTYARTGLNGISLVQSTGITWIGTSEASWVVGFAYNPQALNGNQSILVLLDGSGAAGSNNQVSVRQNTNGTLFIVSGGGTTLGTSTTTVTIGTWCYIEFMVTISSSIAANSCQLRINGVVAINCSSGQSTQHTGNSTADRIAFGRDNDAIVQNNSAYFDDIYILDGTGSVNSFLGDQTINVLYPGGNSSTNTGWTASSGSAYTDINANPPNNGTSYISATTAGSISTFTLASVGTPININGVQIVHDSLAVVGTHTVCDEIRSGGTNYTGKTVTLTSSYLMYTNCWAVDPNTSAAWTYTNLINDEFGVNLVS